MESPLPVSGLSRIFARRAPRIPGHTVIIAAHATPHAPGTQIMNDIANGIQDGIANLSSLIDMLLAAAGGLADVASAMNTILHLIGMLTGS
jgi:hypothetical protein